MHMHHNQLTDLSTTVRHTGRIWTPFICLPSDIDIFTRLKLPINAGFFFGELGGFALHGDMIRLLAHECIYRHLHSSY